MTPSNSFGLLAMTATWKRAVLWLSVAKSTKLSRVTSAMEALVSSFQHRRERQ
jgi:hypothetical protein